MNGIAIAKETIKITKEKQVDEGYGNCFEEVCFAIYGKPDGKNITAFRNEFEEV